MEQRLSYVLFPGEGTLIMLRDGERSCSGGRGAAACGGSAVFSGLELTLCRNLTIVEQTAIRAFTDYAEYLQTCSPLDPCDGLLALVHWAILLPAFDEKDKRTLPQVLEVAHKSNFWSLAEKAVDFFCANCADLEDKADADCLKQAFIEITGPSSGAGNSAPNAVTTSGPHQAADALPVSHCKGRV
jgi:hypothetical protein